MQLLEHYYIIALGAFSNRLGDAFFLVLSILWYFLIWEIRIYHSSNVSKKAESERLLEQITKTYWLCTKCRVHVNAELVPSGFVIGDGYYLAYVDIHQNEGSKSGEGQTYVIYLYGWWTVNALLTKYVLTQEEPTNYKVLLSTPSTHNPYTYIKTHDYFDNNILHANCYRGCHLILEDYAKKQSGVYFLTGEPGMGKTTTARLVANKLNAWLCPDLEEFIKYDGSWIYSFELLYNYIHPDSLNPMVIVLDEVDDFLFTMRRNPDPHSPINVIDLRRNSDPPKSLVEKDNIENYMFKFSNGKKWWSRLLDTIQQKKHVILILTTNRPKSFFDKQDTAMLREYRVSKCLEYTASDVRLIPNEITTADSDSVAAEEVPSTNKRRNPKRVAKKEIEWESEFDFLSH